MDEGGFIVDYIMPAGSSLEETNRVITPRGADPARALRKWKARRGAPACNSAWPPVTEANTGDIAVKLKRDRKRGGEEVIADVRAKIKKAEPVLDVEFPQLLQDMIGDLTSAPEPVVIKLFAQDPELLQPWAPQVADAIKKIPGVVDVLNGIENTISGPATRLHRGSGGDRARRLHPAGSGTGRQRDAAGRAGAAAGGGQRPLLHHPRALPATRRAPRSTPSATRCWSAAPARPRPSARWPAWSRSRARPRSAARTCSATCR